MYFATYLNQASNHIEGDPEIIIQNQILPLCLTTLVQHIWQLLYDFQHVYPYRMRFVKQINNRYVS